MPRRYQERPGVIGGDKLGENGGVWRIGGSSRAFALSSQKSRLSPMRQTPPFSLRSSPPTKPGQPGYLRGVLCALSYSVAPIRGLVADLQSRGNLACILIESRTSRLQSD